MKKFSSSRQLFHKVRRRSHDAFPATELNKMESKTIFSVASLLGATFVCDTQMQLLFVVSVQIAIVVTLAYATPPSLCCIKSLMHRLLLYYQVILPTVLEVVMNVEAWRNRHMESQIRERIATTISNRAAVTFLVKISILLIVRAVKFYYLGIDAFVLSTFLNELVMSSCNYLFCFYVDLMREDIVELKRKIQNHALINLNELEMHILRLKALPEKLLERFTICLFLNITYDFLAFIIHLYWTFIRIVHGPWSSGTLFFNVQPAMNLSTLIITCTTCSIEVR